MVTVTEVAKEILGEDATFDCAVPQPWADKVKDLTDIYAPGHVVWYYPKEGPGKLGGYPVAITEEGRRCLGMLSVLGVPRVT